METNRNVYLDTINWLISRAKFRTISLTLWIYRLINYRKLQKELHRIEREKKIKRETRNKKEREIRRIIKIDKERRKKRANVESLNLLIEQLIAKRNNGEKLSESQNKELAAYDKFIVQFKGGLNGS